ncbi:carbohydrate ABC transporter permease [Erysipelothrix anatis]|uniref:carbohydrate ABC transporter permease n=1 Tax=Erysipelothrix anatis TaxID=2683713 RepID=UPI001356DB5E|nr:carbohydrate ABC transporter permease [Erysipelothrix anatis]
MKSLQKQSVRILKIGIIVLGSTVLIFPIIWMVSLSLKSMTEIASGTPSLIPQSIHLENYRNTWNAVPFTRYTMNTLLIVSMSVIGNTLINSFVAYGLAKVDFKGKRVVFLMILATMMIPGFVTMIPQYILFSQIGWVNTYLPLIVPSFLGNAFYIFLLRQFFKTVPNTVIEAARIEGASHVKIWWNIAAPMIKSSHITVAIFSFNATWNDFVTPLLYLNDEKLYTLQIGLQSFKEQSTGQWNYLMAGTLIVMIPVVVIYFIFQKHFMQGSNIAVTSTK